MDWNVVVTVTAGPGHERRVLDALRAFGDFRASSFRDVCIGRATDPAALLEAIRVARGEGKPWAGFVARVIPVERVFAFTPETFLARLEEAVAPLVARLNGGSFCVRVERRGLEGKVPSADTERALGEHVRRTAGAAGVALRADLTDPDFVIAAETLGAECGVALLPRELRSRYPFVQAR